MAQEIRDKLLTGERALYASRGTEVYNTIFADGESAVKECADVKLYGCMFKWKYPIWYSRNILAQDCTLFSAARAGIWYIDGFTMRDSLIESPKNIRRCTNVKLENVQMSNADETLWHCDGVDIRNVSVHGDYFALNSENMTLDGFTLVGSYSFDGVKNVVIRGAKILSRDTFWNSENVTVYDSYISGEYLGWNAKNLTLINCTVESLQGMCYIENLVMKNCRLLNTTLAFEYSSVEADIVGNIDSVLNPTSGHITADSIGELILERDRIDPEKTIIRCRSEETSTAPSH
ncbi:MAG: DUF3737 family protein [Oscillospiraceae bacterium]